MLSPNDEESMNFTFYTAGEIIFGCGELDRVGDLAIRFGHKALIVLRGPAMHRLGAYERLTGLLKTAGLEFVTYDGPDSEPEVADVDTGAEMARVEQADVVIAVGGGSTIDTGKAISALATNGGSVADYLEGVGRGWTISKPTLPFIAVPTTAGTGAEVTKNAVISSFDKKFKKSARSPLMIPNIALLDPELTLSLPAKQTAECGMDALTQLIESYVSKKSQPIPDALSIYGIRLVGKYLERAVMDGNDIKARQGMLLASLLSGLALANSGLGAAHGIAAALGAVCGTPHGLACAILLPSVMELNLNTNVQKFATIAEAFAGRYFDDPRKSAELAVDEVKKLCDRIKIPKKLSQIGVTREIIPDLVAASGGSSMKGNPKELNNSQIEKLLLEIL
jgi:alcohol dehydrogenase class IV